MILFFPHHTSVVGPGVLSLSPWTTRARLRACSASNAGGSRSSLPSLPLLSHSEPGRRSHSTGPHAAGAVSVRAAMLRWDLKHWAPGASPGQPSLGWLRQASSSPSHQQPFRRSGGSFSQLCSVGRLLVRLLTGRVCNSSVRSSILSRRITVPVESASRSDISRRPISPRTQWCSTRASLPRLLASC